MNCLQIGTNRDYIDNTVDYIIADTSSKKAILFAAIWAFNLTGQKELASYSKDLRYGFGLLTPLKVYRQLSDYNCNPNASLVNPILDTLDSVYTMVMLGTKHNILHLGTFAIPFDIISNAFYIGYSSKDVFEGSVKLCNYRKDTNDLKERVVKKFEKWDESFAHGDQQIKFFAAKRNKWATRLNRWNKFKLPAHVIIVAKHTQLVSYAALGLIAASTSDPHTLPLVIVVGVIAGLGLVYILLNSAMIVSKVKPEAFGLEKNFTPAIEAIKPKQD